MNKFSKYEEFINHYDVTILTEIVDKLKFINYKNIQYLPTHYSLLSIVKEYENIVLYYPEEEIIT